MSNHPEHSHTFGRQREIHLSIDTAPDAWRIVAECDEEITSWTQMGKGGLPVPDADSLAGDLGRSMIADHLAQCEACQKWQGGSIGAVSDHVYDPLREGTRGLGEW
jgi:hypothetical protein